LRPCNAQWTDQRNHLGNDQIFCAGAQSTFYLVTPMKTPHIRTPSPAPMLVQGCWSRGFKRDPLLQTSSPLNTNRELTTGRSSRLAVSLLEVAKRAESLADRNQGCSGTMRCPNFPTDNRISTCASIAGARLVSSLYDRFAGQAVRHRVRATRL
jgi:hypothetical protein